MMLIKDLLMCFLQIIFVTCNDDVNDKLLFNNENAIEESLNSIETVNEETIIENVNIIQVTANSVTIAWSVRNENISSYLIEWSTGDFTGKSERIKENCYTIQNLSSCTTYEIKVTPDLIELDDDNYTNVTSNKINATTGISQPTAPLSLSVNPSKDESEILSLSVSWKVPETGNLCIRYYNVSVEAQIHGSRHYLSEITNNTNIVINNLYSCTIYVVSVKAVDLYGNDGLITTIQSKPTLAKVPKAPMLINSINVPSFISTTTTIIFNWNVFELENNCTIKSVHTECKYYYTKGYGFTLRESGKIDYLTGDQQLERIRLVVDNLSPYTLYMCWCWITNAAGRSKSTDIFVFTQEDAPSPPYNFTLLNDAKLTFAWKPPRYMPGELKQYKLSFSWEPLYPVPEACEVKRKIVISNISATCSNFTWYRGEGYSNYTVYIEALTGGGWSKKSPALVFQSRAKGVPDAVTNLSYSTKPRKNDSNALETIISWNLPCSLKGRLKQFVINAFGSRDELETHTISGIIVVDPEFQGDNLFSINLGELKPQYTYDYEIYAMIHETDEKGVSAKYSAEYPAGIPPEPSENYLKSITLNPDKIKRTVHSFEILLPLFTDTNGYIEYYAIIVSRLGYNGEKIRKRFSTKHGNWPNISSWREAMEKDFKIPYQASEPKWRPNANNILDYGSIKAVKFVVGDDVTCKDVSLLNPKRLYYCNGPLKPDTWYEVRMRAFTNGGFADSSPILAKTDGEVNVILIISLVFGILLFGIIIALLLTGKSYFKQKDVAAEQENEENRYRNRRARPNIQSHTQEIAAPRSRRR